MKGSRVLLVILLASFFLFPIGLAHGQLQTPTLQLKTKLPPLTFFCTVVINNLTQKTLPVVELETVTCADLNGNGKMDEGECQLKMVYRRTNVPPGTTLTFSVYPGSYRVHYEVPAASGINMLYTDYQSVAPRGRVEFPLR